MKKIFLSLLLLGTCFVMAQQPVNHDAEGKCSRFNSCKNSFKVNNKVLTPVADTYNPHYMHIKMEVNSHNTNITGNVQEVSHVSSIQLDTVYLELNPTLSIDSLKFNGEDKDYTFTNAEIFIVLDTPLNAGDEFSTQIYYHGNPSAAGGFFSGLNHEYNYSYDKDVTWTLSEPFSALDWLPIRQSLQYKIDSVDQEYTCANSDKVGSNGLLQEVVDNGDGTHTFHWKTRYPISYYLLAFSVSDYMEYNVYAKPMQLEGDSILIQNFIYNSSSYFDNHKTDIDKSTEIMEVFCEKYGLYPFYEEKYGHCISEIGGGMEHQTMTTMHSFDFGLNAHEMGHQWFGDNITCATWSDIWINEGFASYSSTLASEFLIGKYAALNEITYYQDDAMSDAGGSVFVPEEEVYYGNEWRIFSGRLTYHKGAAILHQLRYLVNDDSLFFAFLNHYTDTFRSKTATGAQFRDAMETYTGLDLHPYFEQWYYGEGYPAYSIACEQGSNGSAHFTVTQTTSAEATPFFDLPLEIKVNYANGAGDSIFRIPITANTTHFHIQLPEQMTNIEIDPNDWIINRTDDITLGVDNLQNDLDIVIGPNPAQDYVQIHFKHADKPALVRLFDISGELIQTYSLKQSGTHIDISALSKGYYLVEVAQEQSKVSKKIVKI